MAVIKHAWRRRRQATDVFEDTQARLHGRPSSRGRAGGVPAATCYMRDMGDPTGSRAPRSAARGHPRREEMQTIRWQLVHPDKYLPAGG